MYNVGCPLCQSDAIHSCVGRPLPPPSPEVEARLTEALERIFGKPDKEKRDALFPRTFFTTPQGEDPTPTEGVAEVAEPSESLT